MVYPGHWDFVKLGEVLLYPVPPSQFLGAMDYFGSNGKGSLRMGHGILSALDMYGQTRQTIVVVMVEEWSKLQHVSHSKLSNADVKEV